jgi:hypothetical protein
MAAVLTSWKEIAQYLGKGVRTVQRWEKKLHLPVRRTGEGGPKSSVLAMPEEIETWIQSQRFRGEHRDCSESQLISIRAELAALRLENAALRQQLDVAALQTLSQKLSPGTVTKAPSDCVMTTGTPNHLL